MQRQLRTELRPAVAADRGVVRSKESDELDFLLSDFAMRSRLRLPEDLLADREVTKLIGSEKSYATNLLSALPK